MCAFVQRKFFGVGQLLTQSKAFIEMKMPNIWLWNKSNPCLIGIMQKFDRTLRLKLNCCLSRKLEVTVIWKRRPLLSKTQHSTPIGCSSPWLPRAGRKTRACWHTGKLKTKIDRFNSWNFYGKTFAVVKLHFVLYDPTWKVIIPKVLAN